MTMCDLRGIGVTLPTEKKIAIELSIEQERRNAHFEFLEFWGVIRTENGKDYYILTTEIDVIGTDDLYEGQTRFLVSQTGTKWFHLPMIDSTTASIASAITRFFTGDLTHVYNRVEGDEFERDESIEINELQRLRFVIDAINADTNIVPKGSELKLVDGRTTRNPYFEGLKHPNDFESYIVKSNGSEMDLKSHKSYQWKRSYDPYKGIMKLTSLYWLGYCFTYEERRQTWRRNRHSRSLVRSNRRDGIEVLRLVFTVSNASSKQRRFFCTLTSVLMSCDICYKRFTVVGDHVPHLFPCGHCYCSRCLTTLFKCRGSAACPGCRMQYHIHNPLSLPKNYKLMEVIEEEKRKSRIRKQNQRSKEMMEMRGFEELAVKFCFQSERLLDVIGEVEKVQHRTIISKEMEKLRVLSSHLSKFQDDDESTTKTTKPRNRRKSQSSVQTKARWRY